MGTTLNFKQPITTRGGNRIRIYYVYEDKIHGAYESDDDWYIACWQFDGHFLPNDTGKQTITTLDLLNSSEEWDIPVDNPRLAS